MSIRPRYAEAILDGDKTIELRRRLPRVEAGTKLWIYATMPRGAVVGVATISRVFTAHPDIIWRDYRDELGVERATYLDYFDEAKTAVAIKLTSVRRVRPVTISQLRDSWPEFHPPQVLKRLAADEIRILVRMSGAKATRHT